MTFTDFSDFIRRASEFEAGVREQSGASGREAYVHSALTPLVEEHLPDAGVTRVLEAAVVTVESHAEHPATAPGALAAAVISAVLDGIEREIKLHGGSATRIPVEVRLPSTRCAVRKPT